MPLPYTYIIYPENPNVIGTTIFAQNSQTGQVEFQGGDAALVFLQTFAERHSILVKAGLYLITSPLNLLTQMTLTFEPGVTLWVPNGYDQHVIGIIDSKQYIRVSGGRIREQQAPNDSQRQWQGIRMLESTGGGGPKIANNTIEGVEIWDADVAIKLLVTHPEGWINGNLFRDIVMFRSNIFIDFDMEVSNTNLNGFNRNLFINIIGQSTSNTEVGVRNIRHRANVFLDVKIWDINQNESGSTATVHSEASDTIIFGGIMTAQNFEDQGRGTQIVDPFGDRRLFLNRLAILPTDAESNDDATFYFDGDRGNLWIGGNDRDGDLVIFSSNASNNRNTSNATFHLDGNGGNLWIGGNGRDGDLAIFPSNASDNHNTNAATLHFDGNGSNLWIGGNGRDGDILLFPSSATNNHTVDQATIHLDANAGEITFSNADCAEEFTIAEAIDAIPGSVMVLNDDGLLQPSNRAYDKRVVGIISGAGKYKPGLLLDKQDRESNRSPIAIMGKVYCMATADVAPINVGDLLTTSHISGHAMKVTDEHKAFGAVVGKALAPFTDGTGLIPVLVALQ
ncbi:hypothetical protein [Coleofasciculus chthonoplastes]|uniref:hypothetical protein n=1 Tax=Coleofasciculus chthonoplastes TaxID=64178 RepID=UPI003301F047